MQLFSIATIVSVALLATRSAGARCTPTQESEFKPINDAIPLRCLAVLDGFETCSDECFAPLEAAAKAAPNCSSLSTGEITKLQMATAVVNKCKAARASSANKYTPQETPDAVKCSFKDDTAWETKYGTTTTFGKCSSATINDQTCSYKCLKVLEEGISAAPPCLSSGNYTMNEYKKAPLVRCLIARKEDLQTNKILQTVATVSGTKSPSATISAPSSSDAISIRGISAVVMLLVLSLFN